MFFAGLHVLGLYPSWNVFAGFHFLGLDKKQQKNANLNTLGLSSHVLIGPNQHERHNFSQAAIFKLRW